LTFGSEVESSKIPVGNAAAISASDSDTINDKKPTMVQFANAAAGPPVYIANPNRTGIPETKFIYSILSASFLGRQEISGVKSNFQFHREREDCCINSIFSVSSEREEQM